MQEQTTVDMSKRKFRIGDLAQELQIKKYIIRFWEKEFDLKSDRSDGGQRFYTEDDLALFAKIKKLLYQEGFTIAGARKQLGIDDLVSGSQTRAALALEEIRHTHGNTYGSIMGASHDTDFSKKQSDFLEKLKTFKETLIELKEKINQI